MDKEILDKEVIETGDMDNVVADRKVVEKKGMDQEVVGTEAWQTTQREETTR